MKSTMQRGKLKRAMELRDGAWQDCAQSGRGRHANGSCVFQRSSYRHLPRQHQSRRHAAEVSILPAHHCGLPSHRRLMPDDATSVAFRSIDRLPHLCHTATSSHVQHIMDGIYSQTSSQQWRPLHRQHLRPRLLNCSDKEQVSTKTATASSTTEKMMAAEYASQTCRAQAVFVYDCRVIKDASEAG